MGAQVQFKSYLPGYYSMRDLNEDADNGSWPLYYTDKTLKSGQYYNGFLPRPTTDLFLGHDKEALKKTMLQHEAIFRHQVYELHRLYGIQIDLMNKLKGKELHQYPMPVETARSSPFSSQILSEGAQKIRHIPSISLVNSACSKPSISGADNIQSSFMEENRKQAGPVPAQNGGSLKDCKSSDSKSKKFHRRMFDLQLPADKYIDSEEGEPFEEEKVSDCRVATESEVKLSLGNGGNPSCQGNASRSDSCLQSTHCLADLNEPIWVEEATSSTPLDFLGPVTHHEEIQGRDQPAKPNSGFLGLPREFFQHTQKGRDNGTQSNILCTENEGSKREWLSYYCEAGKSRGNLNSFPQGFCPEKVPTPFEPVQVEHKKSHELQAFLLSEQSTREAWRETATCSTETRVAWRERATCSTELSERSHTLTNNYQGPVVASHVPCLYPVVPQSDVSNSGSPSVSSWRKPMSCLNQNMVAVQALPCIDPSALSSKRSKLTIQSPGLGDNWPLSSNLRLNQSSGSEVSHINGFCHGSQLESKQVHFSKDGFDYMNRSDDKTSASEQCENHGVTKYFKGSECLDAKSANDMNLNVLPNGFRDGLVSQQDLAIVKEEGKQDLPGGLPWLRAKPTCNIGPAKGRGSLDQIGLGTHAYSQQSENKIETGKGPSPNCTPALCPRDDETKRIDLSDCPSDKRILGFPIFGKPNISNSQSTSLGSPCKSSHYPSEVEDTQNSGKVGILHIDLCLDPILQDARKRFAMENLVVEKGLGSSLTSCRNHINLNSCTIEEETPSESSISRDRMKIVVEIDLEAPAVPETEESICPMEKTVENRLEGLVQSSQHEAGDPQEELVRIAAEALIVFSSSGVDKYLDDDTCHPSDPSLRDSLHWLAEIVSSNMGDLEGEVRVPSGNKGGSDHGESSSEGIDYFESMTLKLTETKVEEYWCKTQPPDNPKEEERGATSKPSRPRRGQGRRGRQRRDFQRDILPGLASLSRHEVTEDLQIIGGLMRATGQLWETGLARRNAARNGWARGRRRSRGSAPAVEASNVCLPPSQQPSNGELGLQERSLTGWGKTPRRPRQQRCPASNPPPLPLTLV